jgi:hypothetical protein
MPNHFHCSGLTFRLSFDFRFSYLLSKSKIEFPEVVVTLEFVRQSIFKSGIVNGLREAFKLSTSLKREKKAPKVDSAQMTDAFSSHVEMNRQEPGIRSYLCFFVLSMFLP